MKKVVIAGGGFAGLNAARVLGNKKGIAVTLIDKTNHHLFQPLLYQVATAGLNPAEIAVPIRSVLKKYKNIRVVMNEIKAFDFQTQTVVTSGDTWEYDYLIVALGGENNYYGNDEWAPYCAPLKSLVDALTIREKLLCALELAEQEKDPEKKQGLLTTVIIGGGPTGVEVAGAVTELKKSILESEYSSLEKTDYKIYLVEGGSRLLGAFHPALSDYTEKQLKKMGVSVLLNSPVESIGENRVVTKLKTLETPNIIWAAGIKGHSLLAGQNIELTADQRAVVDPFYRLSDFPNVYVTGDAAWYSHSHTFNGRPLPAVSPVAIQGARFAARDLLKRLGGKPVRPFRYLYKGMMSTIGRSAAVVEFPFLQVTGFIAWLIWVFVHVMYLVDFQNRVIVFLRWVWYYFSWKKGSRLITRIFSLKFKSAD